MISLPVGHCLCDCYRLFYVENVPNIFKKFLYNSLATLKIAPIYKQLLGNRSGPIFEISVIFFNVFFAFFEQITTRYAFFYRPFSKFRKKIT